MTTREVQTRSATRSTASQLGAKVVHLLLNAVSTLAILRYLAPDAYGTYVLVLTVTTLAGVFADFGLPKLAVREMLVPNPDEGAVVGTVIAMRLALAVVAVGGVQLVLLAFQQSPSAHLAGLVASLGIAVEAVLGIIVSVFHARFVQEYDAVVRVVSEALETGLVLLLVARGVSLPWLFVPPLVGLLVGVALAVSLASRRFQLRPRFDRERVRRLAREALPLGPALMIGVIYLKLDSFVVAALLPSRDLGIYGAAYQPIEYLFLGSAVFINVLYPLAAEAWGAGERARFTILYRRGTELLLIVMLAVPMTVLVVAPGLVDLAFGQAYAASVTPLRLLSVGLVLMVLNGWQSLVLLAGGHQRVTLRYNLFALVFSLAASLVLVRAVGLVGAAIATVATGVLVLVASTLAVRRHMASTLQAPRIALVLGAGVAGLTVAWVLESVGAPWPVSVAVSLATYAAVLVALGAIRPLREVFA